VSINFVDQANAANHYTAPPPARYSEPMTSHALGGLAGGLWTSLLQRRADVMAAILTLESMTS